MDRLFFGGYGGRALFALVCGHWPEFGFATF
jgi:hypothetical protein